MDEARAADRTAVIRKLGHWAWEVITFPLDVVATVWALAHWKREP